MTMTFIGRSFLAISNSRLISLMLAGRPGLHSHWDVNHRWRWNFRLHKSRVAILPCVLMVCTPLVVARLRVAYARMLGDAIEQP